MRLENEKEKQTETETEVNADGDSTGKETEVATDRVEHGEERKKDGERDLEGVQGAKLQIGSLGHNFHVRRQTGACLELTCRT